MTHLPQALIVLLDPEDVRHAFPEWPDIVCLAVCLMRNGDLVTKLFHRTERMEIPPQLVDLLALSEDEVCIVPQVPGYATQPFLYSDERRLMSLIAAHPGILDEAGDYMVNYTYALEEGLDPALMLGLPPRTAQLDQAPVEVAQKPEPMPAPRAASVPKPAAAAPAPREVPAPTVAAAAPVPRAVPAPKPAAVAPAPREMPTPRAAALAAKAAVARAPRPVSEPLPRRQSELSPLLPDFLRKSVEQRRNLRFSTVRTVGLDALVTPH